MQFPGSEFRPLTYFFTHVGELPTSSFIVHEYWVFSSPDQHDVPFPLHLVRAPCRMKVWTCLRVKPDGMGGIGTPAFPLLTPQ